MSRVAKKQLDSLKRAHRVRAIIKSSARPRLSVHISNLHVTSQIIDDTSGKTLVYASTVGKDTAGTKTEKAALVGKDIAAKAKKAKITKVVFDRGKRKYHGRVKALADAARDGGLEF